MMTMRARSLAKRPQAGFTITELMITVALIGVLAAIAIPSFLSYQARTRRSEAFNILPGIARSYISFHAEKGYYPDMFTETSNLGTPATNLPAGGISTSKKDWDPNTQAFFDIVGFDLAGDVWHTYDISTPDNGVACTCTSCFTLTAHGDTDGDTLWGAVMYGHPQRDAGGNVTGWCNSLVGNHSPPAGKWDEPAVNFSLDQF